MFASEFRGSLRRDHPGALSAGKAFVQASFSRNAGGKFENPVPIGGQLALARPRAGLVTELINESYPLFLNSGPVHGPVQNVRRQYIQKPLFSSEVPNDVV